MLRWCPDDPCVALSGRGVALGEDSGRLGELVTGCWRVSSTIYMYIPLYICVFRELSLCWLNGLNERNNWWLLHIYMLYLPVIVICLIMCMSM